VNGAVRDVQHLIMLGVLTAQSADESAPRAPRLPDRFHVATQPRVGNLSSEEVPPLAIRSTPTLAPTGRTPRVVAQGRQPFGVDSPDLAQPERQDERHRAVEISGVAVLDELLELVPKGRGHRHLRRAGFRRPADEGPHRFRTVREFVRESEPFEQGFFLERETNSEESARRRVGSRGPHAV